MEISLYSHESYFFQKKISLCSVDKRCRQQPASIPKHNFLSGCPSGSKPLLLCHGNDFMFSVGKNYLLAF